MAVFGVGNQSKPEVTSLITVPGFTVPGQRTIAGTRKPPSQLVFFSLWLTGYQAGNKSFKVHLNGYDLGPASRAWYRHSTRER